MFKQLNIFEDSPSDILKLIKQYFDLTKVIHFKFYILIMIKILLILSAIVLFLIFP